MKRLALFFSLLLIVSAAACGDDDTSSADTGSADTGSEDTGGEDSGSPDTGDTGSPDTGGEDTGGPDTGSPDTGSPDTGGPDTGGPDTGSPDTGSPDTGSPDTSSPDTGTMCADADGDGVCDRDDPTCESDGSMLACRRVAPPCERGTVPEVRDGCYTDACFTWAECEAATCVELTVDPDSRLYSRLEGTSFNNACRSDADCNRGGCSREVCSADEGVITTCEGIELPAGGCGCVAGECVWHTDSCAP